MYFNPAGVTHLQGRNVSVGFTVIQPSYKFSNDASVSAWTTNGGDAGSTGVVPNGYFTMPVTKDL